MTERHRVQELLEVLLDVSSLGLLDLNSLLVHVQSPVKTVQRKFMHMKVWPRPMKVMYSCFEHRRKLGKEENVSRIAFSPEQLCPP